MRVVAKSVRLQRVNKGGWFNFFLTFYSMLYYDNGNGDETIFAMSTEIGIIEIEHKMHINLFLFENFNSLFNR